MGRPSISAVIPAYHAENWIARAIQSVRNQPNVSAEVIVIEDGVYDNTRRVVEKFSGVRLITLPENRGVAVARNRGLAESTADFVMFLDADDFVEGPFLQGVVASLTDTDADIAFGPWRFGEAESPKSSVFVPKKLDSIGWLASFLTYQPWSWPCPCRLAWRKKSLQRAGGWREDIPKEEDNELLVRCLLRGFSITVSDQGVGVYWLHNHPNRRSLVGKDAISKSQLEIYKLIKQWMATHPCESTFLQQPLAMYCYRNSRESFSTGETKHGEEWLRKARNLGLKGHPGSAKHRALATVFGLRRKQSFGVKIRRLQQALSGENARCD